MIADPRPFVSILLPVFNAAGALQQALDSLIHQTYPDFEILALEDGSQDGSLAVLEKAAQQDHRIRVFPFPHRGLVPNLNFGIETARGELLARMDADDISHPQRLEKQVGFLTKHPEIGVCGSDCHVIGVKYRAILPRPRDDRLLRAALFFENPFLHPSILMRRSIFLETGIRYRLDYPASEDYALWVQLRNVTQFANLPERLITYRRHPAQTTRTQGDVLLNQNLRLQIELLNELIPQPADEEIALHRLACSRRFSPQKPLLQRLQQWLAQLSAINQRRGVFPEPEFTTVLARQWFLLCYRSAPLGLWTWGVYWRAGLAGYGHIPPIAVAKLLLRCLSRTGA